MILRTRIGGIYGRSLAASIGKITARIRGDGGRGVDVKPRGCSIGSASAGSGVWWISPFPFRLAWLVFYLACRLLRVSELDLATRALASPILRRLPNRLKHELMICQPRFVL